MDISVVQIALVFFVILFTSAFSGMAGGGGGLVVLPFFIFIGLSPQQAIATTKFGNFGLSFGSTAAFKKKAFENPKLLIFLLILSLLIGLIVPYIFNSISGYIFQIIIGIIMLLMIPVVLSGNTGLKTRITSQPRKIVGGVLIAIILLLQGLFSGGVGSLANVILISFFGLTALSANAVRRLSTIFLNTFIIIALAISTDFIVWEYALAGIAASFIGGYMGSRIALKQGERFAKYALAAFMLVSGIVLLLTAM